jgi:stringent starvation protein B
MLAACQAAEAVESVIVNPAVPGVELPEYLGDEQLVRLNLVVGRDTPELLMDEWGLRCTLTFRGLRSECALPWAAVLAGVLRAPPRRRPRFQVIEGGKKDDGQ